MINRCRVILKENDKTEILFLINSNSLTDIDWAKKADEETKKYGKDSFDFIDIETKDLPKCPKHKLKGNKENGLYIDENAITVDEIIEAKNKEIDLELEKETPDSIKLIRLNREKEKLNEV